MSNNQEAASQYDPIREKADARKKAEENWQSSGNLSESEARELADFEFESGPQTVTEQVRRYYLKIKSQNPQTAESMLTEVGEVNDEALTEPDIDKICGVLSRYVSGFLIRYNGETYHAGGKGTSTGSERYPTVLVQEITDNLIRHITEENPPRGVNLGGKQDRSARNREADVNHLMSRIKDLGGPRFILSWEGNKIPRGARVQGHEIAWTQNGQVVTTRGETIGTYDRLTEFGGRSGKEQKMVVYLYPSEAKL